MNPAEPDGASLLRVLFAFAFVAGLLGLFGFGLRAVLARGIKLPGAPGRVRRMEIVETLTLDARRRLMIVRCDRAEHLLLLGAAEDVVVARDLEPKP
jgi:flagellar protein FliO/FliZ